MDMFVLANMFSDAVPIWMMVAIDTTVKSCIVIGIILLLIRLSTNSAAAARHHLWLSAMISVLLLPLFTLVLPTWETPYINTIIPDIQALSTAYGDSDLVGANHFTATLHWSIVILIIWLSGLVLVMLRTVTGLLVTWRICRRSLSVEDKKLLSIADKCLLKLKISREVEVRFSDEILLPFSAGFFRQRVILPLRATRWDTGKTESVLLHEFAHAKRLDVPVNYIAWLALAFHWFNPLVWLVMRRLRYEQECAADDCVVLSGADSADYAQYLLEITRSGKSASIYPLPEPAMACQSNLKGRIMEILNNKKNRSHPVLRNRLLIMLAVLVMALSLASAQTWTKGEAPQTPEELPDTNDFVVIDEAPIALYQEPPTYPVEALKKRVEGVVWVKVLIDKEGKPRDAAIMKDSGCNIGFEKAALEAAMKGKWKPAIQGKKPVAVWVSYKIAFKLAEEKKSE